jgi:hypothetical protein
MRVKNRKQFAHRIDMWDEDGANLVDHPAGVEDLDVTAATYRAACRRWPKAKITLRQGARVAVTGSALPAHLRCAYLHRT